MISSASRPGSSTGRSAPRLRREAAEDSQEGLLRLGADLVDGLLDRGHRVGAAEAYVYNSNFCSNFWLFFLLHTLRSPFSKLHKEVFFKIYFKG